MCLLSIIICTRNRALYLRETLHSLSQVKIPQNMNVEVIVVDNASTDNTFSIVHEAMNKVIGLRYILEATPGKSHGLNSGIEKSIGQYLIFTDDDLRFPPNWLIDTFAPLWEGTTDAVLGGIEIAPHLKKPWMTKNFALSMASTECYEHNETAEETAVPQFDLIGANMGFARHVLEKVPRFDPELGPGALGMGEDTLFSMQVRSAGFCMKASLDTKIEHHFDPARLSRNSGIRRFANQGKSVAYIDHHWEHTKLSYLHFRHLAGSVFYLAKWRLLHFRKWRSKDVIDMEEMHWIEQYAFFKQRIIESRRPRNYAFHGFVRVR